MLSGVVGIVVKIMISNVRLQVQDEVLAVQLRSFPCRVRSLSFAVGLCCGVLTSVHVV